MPIKVEEAKKYKGYEEAEIKIIKFLESNKGWAFTSDEIRKGIRFSAVYVPDEQGSYWAWQNVGMLVLDVVLFETTLEELVKKRKISVSEVGERSIISSSSKKFRSRLGSEFELFPSRF